MTTATDLIPEEPAPAGPGPSPIPESEADHASPLTLSPEMIPATGPEKPKRKRRTKAEMAAARGESSAGDLAADKRLLAEAFEGTFVALSIGLGDHWRLAPETKVEIEPGKIEKRPAESELLADVWQPVFERYGGKATGEMIMWVSASTVTLAIVAPRVRHSVQQESGVIGWIKRKLAARRRRA